MSNFIDTDYMFPLRMRVFSISKRTWLTHKGLFQPALEPSLKDEERQGRLQDLVEHFRPELAGCMVFSFRYDMPKGEWQIGVDHGSLPAVQNGDETPQEPLIPETWRDRGPLL